MWGNPDVGGTDHHTVIQHLFNVSRHELQTKPETKSETKPALACHASAAVGVGSDAEPIVAQG